jgi:hypothetical protein
MTTQESLDKMDKPTMEQKHPLGTRRKGKNGLPEVYCKFVKEKR